MEQEGVKSVVELEKPLLEVSVRGVQHTTGRDVSYIQIKTEEVVFAQGVMVKVKFNTQ